MQRIYTTFTTQAALCLFRLKIKIVRTRRTIKNKSACCGLPEQPGKKTSYNQGNQGGYSLLLLGRFLLKGWITPRFRLVGILFTLGTDDTEHQRHHHTDYDYCRQHTVNKLFYSGIKIRIYLDSCVVVRDFFIRPYISHTVCVPPLAYLHCEEPMMVSRTESN